MAGAAGLLSWDCEGCEPATFLCASRSRSHAGWSIGRVADWAAGVVSELGSGAYFV